MRNDNEKMVCRVCGLTQHEPPWGGDGKSPNFDICSCCGVEFGYEDSSFISTTNYRRKWLENGAKWFDLDEMPTNWCAKEQLKNVPVDFK
ncbi:hypothetical protein [Vibrio hyugaensis]|uniref:hypothetical protein n=1 Tax=Vibrio hyugaensis TaxID=1534743 RepID=UPI003DA18464